MDPTIQALLDQSGVSLEQLAPILRSPQTFVETFLRNPESDQIFKLNGPQRDVFRAAESRNPHNAICLHRRAGKCSEENELIPLADGRRIRAGDLIGTSFDLLTLKDGQIRPVKAFAEYNAFEGVFEIETESGRRVVRNAEHPFFRGESQSTPKGKPDITSHGWTPCEDLKVGDLIAAPRYLPFESPGLEVSDSEIKLVAYLIGDGGLTTRSMVAFSQIEGEQLDEMRQICADLGITLRKRGGDSRCDWTLTGVGQVGGSRALQITRKYGLQGKGSFTKFVPPDFFHLSSEQLAVFLSRLYSTDGWACPKTSRSRTARGAGQIGYCSVSRQLIDDVQHLLLRFGVNSRIDYKPGTKSYTLSIDNFEDIIAFVENVGIYGKQPACSEVYARSVYLRDKKYGKAESLVWEDGHLYKSYVDGILCKRPGKGFGKRYPSIRKIDVTPWRIKNAPPQCRWERVSKVTKLPPAHTVAITVPETQTYFTDFYEHNTASLVLLTCYLLLTKRNCKILFMAPFNSQVEAFFNELKKIVDFHPWIASCVAESTKNPYWLKFTNGSAIRGMTTGSKSKSKAGSARGQGAHYILLDEVAFMSDEDFAALKPIIEGDAYHERPVVFAVSTPMGAVGQFYRWVENIRPDNGEDYEPWNVIRLAITENPDWSPERVEKIRNEVTSREWQTEYLCQFLNTGDSVFDLAKLRECGSLNYGYADIPPKPPLDRDPNTGKTTRRFWRTMGVDWDKYNRDGSGPTIVILDCDERLPGDGCPGGGDGKLRVAWRESIPQSEYCLTRAVEKVIELNRLYAPDAIYVDAGLGEMQVEYLHAYGLKHPETRLRQKVRRQSFKENVEIQNPLGGVIKKAFKPFMVNVLTKWIEDRALAYPTSDREFYEQFSSYRVKSFTLSGEQYTAENEHIIDATGLAAVAMFQIHASPFRHQTPIHAVVVPPQTVVPGDMMTDEQRKFLKATNPVASLIVSRDRKPVHPDVMRGPQVTYDTPKSKSNPYARDRSALMTRRRRSSF